MTGFVNFEKKSADAFAMSHEEVRAVLPHRYPFLLIDKVLELEPLKRITALKNVTANEEFFNGHFPQMPIMPGVLIIEAMAQASGILGIKSYVDGSTELESFVYLLSVDGAKFRHPVKPGDTLIIKGLLEKRKGEICIFACECFVDGRLVSEAKITAKVSIKK
jgi:3-hydroxyacyl-[acyl-carrier-protein] dehydratase